MNRLLLVEDDPLAREVLARHARTLQFVPLAAATLAEARILLRRGGRFAASVIDLDLPDGPGSSLLADHREALGTPIASSADWDPGKRRAALDAGFHTTLAKPCSREALEAALAGIAHVAETHGEYGAPIFDDDAALRALGSKASVQALRRLLADELPAYRSRMLAHVAEDDQPGLRAQLHRLVSAAGFTGAAALRQAVTAYQAAPAAERLEQVLIEIDRCLLALPKGA